MQPAFKKTKITAVARWADRTAYNPRPPSDFGLKKESNFPE